MTTPQWTSDIAIDATLAKRAIAEQFRTLELRDVVPIGEGWDNAAFLVDGKTVFRFPRRRLGAELLDIEVAVLPGIATDVPLRTSAPTLVGLPTELFPWPFAGYEHIPGATGCSYDLTDDERARLAIPLARFLRALHAIDPQRSLERGLPPDRLGRLEPAKRLSATRDRLGTVRGAGADAGLDTATAWLEAHPPVALPDAGRVVVHGDLYARHVLLDERSGIAGIIEWGDVHYGDPAIDLSIAHLMLPHGAHAHFRDAYGPIDERTWNVARCRAIYHAILELEYGIRADDPGMRRIGRAALRLIAAELETTG